MKMYLGMCLILVATAAQASDFSPEPDIQYVYEAGGRRDPFVSVYGSKNPVPPGAIAVSNCVLAGISRGPSGFVALLEGSDRKARAFREGDTIYDAVIVSITPEEVVFKQDVRKMDPSSVIMFREVRKRLHNIGE